MNLIKLHIVLHFDLRISLLDLDVYGLTDVALKLFGFKIFVDI